MISLSSKLSTKGTPDHRTLLLFEQLDPNAFGTADSEPHFNSTERTAMEPITWK